MDKFGIFNLLNSFLGQTKRDFSSDLDKKDQPEKAQTDTPDLVKNLFSILNSNPSQKNFPSEQSPTNANAQTSNNQGKKVGRPLQNDMLSTMASHDKLVNRVRAKNKN